MKFKTASELQSYIVARMQPAVQEAVNKAYEVIDQTLKQWYGSYQPQLYERTYQLFSSLVKVNTYKSGNGYSAEVYFDASSMNYTTGAQPSGEQVIDAAMSGGHGATGLKVVSTTIPIWSTSMGQLDPELYVLIEKALKASGIPIRRKKLETNSA